MRPPVARRAAKRRLVRLLVLQRAERKCRQMPHQAYRHMDPRTRLAWCGYRYRNYR